MILNTLKFAIFSALGGLFLSPTSEAAIKELKLNSKTLKLDAGVWSYYAPGSLRPHGVLPLSKHDGVLIKNVKSKDKRLVYLIHSAPKTTTLQIACADSKNAFRNLEVLETKKSCRLVRTSRLGNLSFQWMYEDQRDLKLVSFHIEVPTPRKAEVMQDLQLLEKELLK